MKITRARSLFARARGGFTLAEVAVTVAIVGITLMVALQSMQGAKLTAAHTRNMKLARELGLLTLGQIEAGLFWEEIDTGIVGSYSEEDQPDFYYEIALGDDTFVEYEYDDKQPFDNWQYKQDLLRDDPDYDEDEDEETKEPYEKVRIKVTFPALTNFTAELVLERWIPWEQVYGESEEDIAEDEAAAAEGDASAAPGGDAGSAGNQGDPKAGGR